MMLKTTLIAVSAVAFLAATTTVSATGNGNGSFHHNNIAGGGSAKATGTGIGIGKASARNNTTVNNYMGGFDSARQVSPASTLNAGNPAGGTGGSGGSGGTGTGIGGTGGSSGGNYFSSDNESNVYAPVATVSSSNNTAPCQKNRSFALGAYLASFGFSTTADSDECWDSWFAQQAMASGSSKLKNSGAELLDLNVQDRIDGLKQRIAEKRKNRKTSSSISRTGSTSDPRGEFSS